MEQELRQRAIKRYLKGESPKSIYTDLKRSKNWFFKWLRRYQSGETLWYKDKSKAPKTRPTVLSETEKRRIISTRIHLASQCFAQIGPSAIKWELSKSGYGLPSDSTIKRVLKREGLIKKNFVYSQRRWVPVFHRSAWHQQHPPGRPCRPTVHKARWQILLFQRHGFVQPSGLHWITANQRGSTSRFQSHEILEGNGAAGFSATWQWAELSRQ